MTAWTTTQGPLDKATYQGMVKLLARMCSRPLVFVIDSLTAEEDRVVAEARSEGVLVIRVAQCRALGRVDPQQIR